MIETKRKTPVQLIGICCMLLIFQCIAGGETRSAHAQTDNTGKATIAILSHTDFLPDSTGVYDRRSWHGRDKDPISAADNDLRTGSDQAYDKIDRGAGYDPEAVGLPEILADAILEQLSKSKRFVPVERKTLRTSILEQRFGKELQASYLDRTLDKAIADMDKFEVGGDEAMGHTVAGAKYDDLLHDFKDLGNAVGAKYMVLGNLHMLGSSVESKKVPLSERNRQVHEKIAEARLRLRVIDSETSTVVGADSLHVKVSNLLFEGGKESKDDFAFMNKVAKDAANKILNIVFPAKIVSMAPPVISRGTNDGVSVGDTYSILREGKEIKEASGEVIARLKQKIGAVKVIEVQETISIVAIEQGADFNEGDLAIIASQEEKMTTPPPTAAVVPLKKTAATPATPATLPRVAVGLVKAGSTAKTGQDAGIHIPIFTDTILTQLVQTRRFKVIDRQEVDQLLDEQTAQALAENRSLPSAMGSLKGCDYLMIGALQNFSIEEEITKLPNSTRVIKVLDGFAEGNMRLVDARSGDILESRKISVREQLEIQAGNDRLVTALADRFAEKVIANLMNAIYPMKIAAVSPDGSIYINRGKDGQLTKGSKLNVLRAGQKVIDPDTGVELGSVESQIGKIELVNVEENRSIGKLIDGEEVQSGDLLKLEDGVEVARKSHGMQRSGASLPGSKADIVNKSTSQRTVAGGKATLALPKITVNVSQTSGPNTTIIQQNSADLLTDSMVDALSKTNRFNMMERRKVDQLIDEKAFNAIAQREDIRAYLQELEGSDYLAMGELTSFYLQEKRQKVAYVDETMVTHTGFIEGNLRLVDSHTGGIISTEKIRVKKKFKNMSVDEIRTKLIDLYAMKAAAGVVLRIFPVKILAAMPDGTVFINRGKDAGIKTGSTFSVERPGGELIDPDTGVSFGKTETAIGVLKVTQVETSRSRAIMIAGGEPSPGDILRAKNPVARKTKKKMKVAW